MPDQDEWLQHQMDDAADRIAPRAHQAQGLQLSDTHRRFLFAWKPGTGKTFLQLFIMRERPMRTVIVAQKSIIPTAWETDAEDIGQPTRIIHAGMTRAKRSQNIASCPSGTALVMNFEMMTSHAKDLLAWGIQRLIIDESSKLKNHKTRVWSSALTLADASQEVYLLSGTPAPNSPIELWPQLRLLSPRAAGRTFFSWAYQWFVPVKINVRYTDRYGRSRERSVVKEWVPKAGTEEAFNRSMEPWIWYLSKEECVDLPAKTDSLRLFDLSREERRIYDDLLDEYRLTVGDESRAIKSEAQTMKLRQATAGSVITGKETVFFGSTKLDELMVLLEELGSDTRVVIWAEFVNDIERIVEELNRTTKEHPNGFRSAVSVRGGTKTPIRQIVEDFVAGRINVIVAHPKSMGHGTDGLQAVCSDAVYFGLSYSGEEHEQSQDRIHRSGQNDPCTYHYLLAKDTIDESLYATVKGKVGKQEVLLKEFRRNRRTRR